MKYVAFSRNPVHPLFHCGFQPEGKPYADYVAHIESCRDLDCIRRSINRRDLSLYLYRKYGMLRTNATPAASPARQALPVAQSKTGQRA